MTWLQVLLVFAWTAAAVFGTALLVASFSALLVGFSRGVRTARRSMREKDRALRMIRDAVEARPRALEDERCESGCHDPVTRRDADGVPLCEACWQSLCGEQAAWQPGRRRGL